MVRKRENYPLVMITEIYSELALVMAIGNQLVHLLPAVTPATVVTRLEQVKQKEPMTRAPRDRKRKRTRGRKKTKISS